MRDPDHLAELLALSAAIYRERSDHATFDSLIDVERCQRLNAYCVLSLAAISAIVGVSKYKVEKYTNGQNRPATRGRLNPNHLAMLAYMLSDGKVRHEWLAKMLSEGTSISTISDLTNISEATLYRRKNV